MGILSDLNHSFPEIGLQDFSKIYQSPKKQEICKEVIDEECHTEYNPVCESLLMEDIKNECNVVNEEKCTETFKNIYEPACFQEVRMHCDKRCPLGSPGCNPSCAEVLG